MDEAERQTRGACIYTMLIGNLEWCSSFNGPDSPPEEVARTVRRYRERLRDRLHLTLVALGDQEPGALEPWLDDVLRVPKERLGDVGATVRELGVWAAERVRTQSRRLNSLGR